MAGPAWLADGFAAVVLLTALYCAARLVLARTQRRPTEQDVDLGHVLMGAAMAGMLAPRVVPLPGPAQPGGALWAGAWSLVFGLATVWFAGRIALSYRATGRLRPVGSHHLPHMIMSATMVYMLATVARPGQPSGAGLAGTAGPSVHFPLLALILAQFMVGYVMWTADRLPALARVRASRPAPAALAPAPADPASAGLVPLAPATPGRASPGLVPLAPATPGPASPGLVPFAPATPGPASPGLVPLAPATVGPNPDQDPDGRAADGPAAAPSPPLSLRLASCCNIVMGLVMGYMLVISL